MATLTPNPKMQFFDQNGNPLVGGKVYTYLTGTLTPQFTFTDATGTVNNTNPVILDARGEASIWLGNLPYRFILKTADDVTVWTSDGLSGYLTPTTKGVNRFTADGSFTVPVGVSTIWISGVAGGGGGGGGGSNNAATSIGQSGGGGGAGQAAFKKIQPVTQGEVIAITIGLGGAGGAGGTSGNDNAATGANGTDTIVGAYLTLAHGLGGTGGAISTGFGVGTGLGGLGGSGGTFGALIDGQRGGYGSYGSNGAASDSITYFSGDGGSTMFGAGGRGKRNISTGTNFNGDNGQRYGAGGAGGGVCFDNPTGGGVGGSGSDGMVLIEW